MEMMEAKPLTFQDIIPDPKMYDKMKPPKLEGYPTKVSFHVTVMGLDSINEYSMVSKTYNQLEGFLQLKNLLVRTSHKKKLPKAFDFFI